MPFTSRRRFLRSSVFAATGLIVTRARADAWRTGNEVIDGARETALGILQPTDAQLQRGLELHANALVFDAYGFAPRAAIDAARVNEAVAAGASPAELNDLREEISMTRMATDERERRRARGDRHGHRLRLTLRQGGAREDQAPRGRQRAGGRGAKVGSPVAEG